jgi:hypothetical protein
MSSAESAFQIHQVENDFPAFDFENDGWDSSERVVVTRNWDASTAAAGRHFSVSAVWSDSAIYFRFLADQRELLVVDPDPQLERKTSGLWERDVCEVFIAPDVSRPNHYSEFEVAPTGEWLDLAIDSSSGERVTDWDYRSGMEAAARIEANRVIMAIKIPWKAFGRKPEGGAVWQGNIFRCVGEEPNRGYLAWQPTLTATPNFHVPEKFGEFVFVR